MDELLLQLCYYLSSEEYEYGSPKSTLLIYFCGVLGISADGSTFQRARLYTPKLSGMIYCTRLILFESALPRFAHSRLGWKKRPRFRQLARLQHTRRRKMCSGSQAPLGEMLGLRSYGRALAKSEGPSFHVNWSDDGQEILWDGQWLSMLQFRKIGHNALESATATCNQLMYDWKPACHLDNIKDILSESAEGYSFVSEPKNGLSKAYVELLQRACSATTDGLMAGNAWNAKAVERYLTMHEDMLQQIALLVYLTAGQAPRGSELFSVEHRNGPSTLRGVCVHDGKMAFITRHHKARRATNNEFQVARYPPAEAGAIVYRYLVYIRPVVSVLYRVCRDVDYNPSLLFASHARPNEPWETDRLSKALQRQTADIIGISIGVQLYRQLSIAITEKHIRQISRPFDRFDDKRSSADVEHAFAWQSGHRPVERGNTYGLDGAFPNKLQPQLLRIYIWVSWLWHRFLQLDGAAERRTERVTQDASQAQAVPANETRGQEAQEQAVLANQAQAVSDNQAREQEPVQLRKRSIAPPRAPSPKRRVVIPEIINFTECDDPAQPGGQAAEEEQRPAQDSAAEDGYINGWDETEEEEIRLWRATDLTELVDPRAARLQAAADAVASRLLHYNVEYKVLICREHRYAIRGLYAHLQQQHLVATNIRRILVERYGSLALVEPKDVRLPPLGPPINELRPPVDVLRCAEPGCGYTSVAPTAIRQHCNSVHKWRAAARGDAYWTRVKAQTFFAGAWQRWFTVQT
jgi:Orsellinic acid/F9775 biosynthesis cluster protein D